MTDDIRFGRISTVIWFKLGGLDSGPGVLAPGDPLRRLAMHGGDFRQSLLRLDSDVNMAWLQENGARNLAFSVREAQRVMRHQGYRPRNPWLW